MISNGYSSFLPIFAFKCWCWYNKAIMCALACWVPYQFALVTSHQIFNFLLITIPMTILMTNKILSQICQLLADTFQLNIGCKVHVRGMIYMFVNMVNSNMMSKSVLVTLNAGVARRTNLCPHSCKLQQGTKNGHGTYSFVPRRQSSMKIQTCSRLWCFLHAICCHFKNNYKEDKLHKAMLYNINDNPYLTYVLIF